MEDQSTQVTLRPVTAEDEPFLMAVYASTRLAELALTNWDEAQRAAFIRMQFTAQLTHYRQHYPEGEHSLILAAAQPVGRLYVARRAGDIRILDITLLPQHRGRRIGTPIIEGLMAEAEAANQSVSIYVESYNPSLRLFERLGFRRSGAHGPSHLLEWRAAT